MSKLIISNEHLDAGGQNIDQAKVRLLQAGEQHCFISQFLSLAICIPQYCFLFDPCLFFYIGLLLGITTGSAIRVTKQPNFKELHNRLIIWMQDGASPYYSLDPS